MSILYLTSFNEKLYNASGREMLESFYSSGCEGEIAITYNGNNPLPANFRPYIALDLDKSDWLISWKNRFKEYLPKKYGGVDNPNLTINLDPKNQIRYKNGMFFREQTGRWMYKVAALQSILDLAQNFSYLIYCDCDTVFKKPIVKTVLDQKFKNVDVAYHLGQYRLAGDNGIESGFVVYNMEKAAKLFLQEYFRLYDSGDFLKYYRFDDGYILHMTTLLHKQFNYLDMVEPHQLQNGGHVVRNGIMRDFIEHNKGLHLRSNVI